MQRPVLLLDALGTLLELEPPAPALRDELVTRFEIAVSEEQAQRALAAEIAYYRAHLDEGRDAASLATLRARCASVLREALPPAQELETQALTDALLASLRFRAYPDVRPALEKARARGVKLVVVSNWDVSLIAVLDHLGVARYLDGILTSAAAGARKPAPQIFERALRIVDARPKDAVHVGDSLEEDVAGARNAGIEPILIRRNQIPPTQPAPPGIRTIASLTELEP